MVAIPAHSGFVDEHGQAAALLVLALRRALRTGGVVLAVAATEAQHDAGAGEDIAVRDHSPRSVMDTPRRRNSCLDSSSARALYWRSIQCPVVFLNLWSSSLAR